MKMKQMTMMTIDNGNAYQNNFSSTYSENILENLWFPLRACALPAAAAPASDDQIVSFSFVCRSLSRNNKWKSVLPRLFALRCCYIPHVYVGYVVR